MTEAVLETALEGLEQVHRGKVRDVYAVDEEHLLLVATDRISAFDRVLASGIPGKGAVLTQTSNFWFEHLSGVAPSHLVTPRAAEMPPAAARAARGLAGRAVLVRKVKIVPIECIVRGFLAGSKVKEYERTGAIQGVELPPGLVIGGELPEPIFTPTTKAVAGHDEPITYEELVAEVGDELATRLRELSLRIFREASEHCRERGLLLCDTKFEFGHLPDGRLVLADEVLTPDSSRFFKADEHRPGEPPVPWDKQLVRDYLLTLPEGSMEAADAPALPERIVHETAARYREVYERISGRALEEAVAEAVA
ncbi:MAG: phosphoribosylaminoimidazolesuccinocarboxamide synthase [Planctomycetota bacterium]|nr:MAG: phosphoribosylaminoimidazolesuccinocarboxamide synthase [Planctomycetota bacterium]